MNIRMRTEIRKNLINIGFIENNNPNFDYDNEIIQSAELVFGDKIYKENIYNTISDLKQVDNWYNYHIIDFINAYKHEIEMWDVEQRLDNEEIDNIIKYYEELNSNCQNEQTNNNAGDDEDNENNENNEHIENNENNENNEHELSHAPISDQEREFYNIRNEIRTILGRNLTLFNIRNILTTIENLEWETQKIIKFLEGYEMSHEFVSLDEYNEFLEIIQNYREQIE